MVTAVLDASALLALLLGEPGAQKVEAVLADSVMSTVNLAEIVEHYARNGVAEPTVRQILAGLPIAYADPDEALAYDIGMLQPVTAAAGLSLGDRACLALARRLGLMAWTADRSWSGVQSKTGIRISLIR